MSLLSTTTYATETPDHMRRRKITKKGFRLCLMVCGRSGTGKSTFVNTLCDDQVSTRATNAINPDGSRNMLIRESSVQFTESDGTTIALTIVDTPGFGDNINNEQCAHHILTYIENQFDAVLAEETRVHRNPHFTDKRVHACLYFIAATSHGLSELDAQLMKKISNRVNVIPVIAKADTYTDDELSINKARIMTDIQDCAIPIFNFSVDETDSDDDVIEECNFLRGLLPFAVVGSNDIFDNGKGLIRGREYPWGFVKVEDPEHSDFVALRSVIFGSHLQELRDLTHEMLYERYRSDKLSQNPDLLRPHQEESVPASLSEYYNATRQMSFRTQNSKSHSMQN